MVHVGKIYYEEKSKKWDLMEIPGSLPPQTRFSFWVAMDDLNDHHYMLSKVFLSLIGLWPYENTLFAYVKRVFSILILSSCIVFQIAALLRTTEYTKDQLLNTITNVALITVFIVKWCTFWHHMEDIKKHINTIRDNWTYMKDVNEQRIILKYADHGMFLTRMFMCILYLGLGIYLIYLTWLNSFDSTIDKIGNSIDVQIKMDYFTEGEIYTYVAMLHVYIVAILGITTVLGSEITAMLFLSHACGLFRVACYHITNSFTDGLLKTTISKRNMMVRDRLISAAKVHKRALQYCKQTDTTLGLSYIILLVTGIGSLSLNLLRLSQAMLESELTPLLLELTIVFVHFTYLFLANYMGQIVMDNSSIVFMGAYQTLWYTMPVPTQKLFLYIMHHSTKHYSYRLAGLFTPCYEGFSTLTKMSFSYFTVIHSSQS